MGVCVCGGGLSKKRKTVEATRDRDVVRSHERMRHIEEEKLYNAEFSQRKKTENIPSTRRRETY